MSMDLFKKIIDEVATIPEITIVDFSGLGEPLLDPFIEERISYVKQNTKAQTQFATNGILLYPVRLDSIRNAGLDNLIISLNANSAEQHEKIMQVKGQFPRVLKNIEYALVKGGYVTVHAVITGDTFTNEDAQEFVRRWGKFACCRKEIRHGTGKPNPARCWRALTNIYVMYDGTMTPCCFDMLGKLVLGNLSNQSIREIYNSSKHLGFREDHWENRADKWDICRNCPR